MFLTCLMYSKKACCLETFFACFQGRSQRLGGAGSDLENERARFNLLSLIDL